jgi:hypothetical protein
MRLRDVIIGVSLCFSLCLPINAAIAEDDIAELKRAIKELQAQNRELTTRVTTLEAGKTEPGHNSKAEKQKSQVTKSEIEEKPKAPSPAIKATQVEPTTTVTPLPPPPNVGSQAAAESQAREVLNLEHRVKDLELTQTAQEDATRSIIQSALSKLGPKINEFVSFGGSTEVLVGHFRDFTGPPVDEIALNTVELDFEIKANEWASSNLILEYNNGTNVLFPTTVPGFSTGVDRITVNRGIVTVGDVQKFPLYVEGGQDTLTFGTSTGVLRLDVLSINSPTSIEVFEIRKPLAGFGFAFPTPALTQPSPPVVIPPVRPLVINPLVKSLARGLGYEPIPTKPSPPKGVTLPPTPPPIYGSIFFYQGDQFGTAQRYYRNYNASLGFRAGGHCGRPYEELTALDFCPWAVDFHADFNGSVYNSFFLQDGYRAFLNQIGYIPGGAVSAKARFGPVSLVAELDGAMRKASFLNGLGTRVSIRPAAWQISAGYQFDWNPWVEAIGEQGDFISISYSGTSNLFGTTQLINNQPTRVGFAPQNRLLFTLGEWVLDNLKWSIEYSMNWDYPPNKGGTGNLARGIFTQLTYDF